MSREPTLDKKIRDRMIRTGETHVIAGDHRVEESGSEPAGTFPVDDIPNLVPRYTSIAGGSHVDHGILRNLLVQAGVASPHDGEPYSDAMLYGLCGGIGFIYFVFEYKGFGPTMFVGLRGESMPGPFVIAGLERVGVEFEVAQTGSPKLARKHLDTAIAAGRAAMCTVDAPSLPYSGQSQILTGTSPRQIAVIGENETHVWIDDRALVRLSHEELATARAAYKKAKHRLITVRSSVGEVDLAASIREAIGRTATRFHEPMFKGYAANFGLRGQEKLARLLIDDKDKKGWPTQFGAPRTAFFALRRFYECVELAHNAPAGGRGVYAEFLDEAAEITGLEDLRIVADAMRQSATIWRDMAKIAIGDGDSGLARVPALADACRELLQKKGRDAVDGIAALTEEGRRLADACDIDDAERQRRYREISAKVEAATAVERRAVGALLEIVGG